MEFVFCHAELSIQANWDCLVRHRRRIYFAVKIPARDELILVLNSNSMIFKISGQKEQNDDKDAVECQILVLPTSLCSYLLCA